MVQELRDHNRRRMELASGVSKNVTARLIRGYLIELMGSGYTGTVKLGDYSHADDYVLREGKIIERTRVGRRWFVFPRYERREITPEQIPFESYISHFDMEDIAERVEEVRNSFFSNGLMGVTKKL